MTFSLKNNNQALIGFNAENPDNEDIITLKPNIGIINTATRIGKCLVAAGRPEKALVAGVGLSFFTELNGEWKEELVISENAKESKLDNVRTLIWNGKYKTLFLTHEKGLARITNIPELAPVCFK